MPERDESSLKNAPRAVSELETKIKGETNTYRSII
jgi:hypothetical protein